MFSICLYVGWSLEYPYFHFFRLYVCMFVCNGQLWRPEESTDFDETWLVGSYQDLVVCFWAPLLWTPPLPSNGALKFLKNPKKLILSKIKNRLPGFFAHYNQPLSKIFSPIRQKLWLVCNYVATTQVAYRLVLDISLCAPPMSFERVPIILHLILQSQKDGVLKQPNRVNLH